MPKDEIEEVDALVVHEQITPMTIIDKLVDKGAGLDQIEKFMALQDRNDKTEARKAYNLAFAKFNENPPQVVKDVLNKQYNSMYASLGAIVNTIKPALGAVGISTRWDVDQATGFEVTCVMTHAMGHSESLTIKGPIDQSGKKNDLQQIKSTFTYLRVATFEGVTGIVTVNSSCDDDGNGAGKTVEYITEDQQNTIEALIRENATDPDKSVDAVLAFLGIENFDQLPVKKFRYAMKSVNDKIKAKAKK